MGPEDKYPIGKVYVLVINDSFLRPDPSTWLRPEEEQAHGGQESSVLWHCDHEFGGDLISLTEADLENDPGFQKAYRRLHMTKLNPSLPPVLGSNADTKLGRHCLSEIINNYDPNHVAPPDPSALNSEKVNIVLNVHSNDLNKANKFLSNTPKKDIKLTSQHMNANGGLPPNERST